MSLKYKVGDIVRLKSFSDGMDGWTVIDQVAVIDHISPDSYNPYGISAKAKNIPDYFEPEEINSGKLYIYASEEDLE